MTLPMRVGGATRNGPAIGLRRRDAPLLLHKSHDLERRIKNLFTKLAATGANPGEKCRSFSRSPPVSVQKRPNRTRSRPTAQPRPVRMAVVRYQAGVPSLVGIGVERLLIVERVFFIPARPERWPSGRRRSPAKGVGPKRASRVRIPSSPPVPLSRAGSLRLRLRVLTVSRTFRNLIHRRRLAMLTGSTGCMAERRAYVFGICRSAGNLCGARFVG